MTAHLITSFIAASGFGILFNAPKRVLIQCGLIGMSGWFLFHMLELDGMNMVPATALGAILAGVLSQWAARLFKVPVLVISVSGIIPLVPGGVSYNAMRHFVENDYFTGVELSAKVMLLAGAIAIGLIFAEVANQIMIKLTPRKK